MLARRSVTLLAVLLALTVAGGALPSGARAARRVAIEGRVTEAAVAGARGVPVLLSGRDELPDATASALGSVESATVVGGTAALSDDVLAEVAARTSSARRVAGATRYATSAAVVAQLASAEQDRGVAWLATGRNWPDALAAGPAAAAAGGVLVLVDGAEAADAPPALDLLAESELREVVLAGDTGVIAPNVEVAVRELLNADLLAGTPFAVEPELTGRTLR